jgi:hypothetical protein
MVVQKGNRAYPDRDGNDNNTKPWYEVRNINDGSGQFKEVGDYEKQSNQ